MKRAIAVMIGLLALVAAPATQAAESGLRWPKAYVGTVEYLGEGPSEKMTYSAANVVYERYRDYPGRGAGNPLWWSYRLKGGTPVNGSIWWYPPPATDWERWTYTPSSAQRTAYTVGDSDSFIYFSPAGGSPWWRYDLSFTAASSDSREAGSFMVPVVVRHELDSGSGPVVVELTQQFEMQFDTWELQGQPVSGPSTQAPERLSGTDDDEGHKAWDLHAVWGGGGGKCRSQAKGLGYPGMTSRMRRAVRHLYKRLRRQGACYRFIVGRTNGPAARHSRKHVVGKAADISVTYPPSYRRDLKRYRRAARAAGLRGPTRALPTHIELR